MPKKVLFVDDEEDQLELYSHNCALIGYSVVAVACAEEALERFSNGLFDIVVTDQNLGMGKLTGHDLIGRLRAQGYTGPVLMAASEAPHPSMLLKNADVPDEFSYPFLRKAYSVSDMRRRISELLG